MIPVTEVGVEGEAVADAGEQYSNLCMLPVPAHFTSLLAVEFYDDLF